MIENEYVEDVMGNEINPGDPISYPVRRGSTLSVVTGTVERIKPNGKLQVRRSYERTNYGIHNYFSYTERLVDVAPTLVTLAS